MDGDEVVAEGGKHGEESGRSTALLDCACRAFCGPQHPPTMRYRGVVHHPGCMHRGWEDEAREHLAWLLYSLDVWATDEDGLHPSVVEAYKEARAFVGCPVADAI